MDADQAKASFFCTATEVIQPWIGVSRKVAELAYKRVEEFETDIDVNDKSLLESVLKIMWRSLIDRDED